MKFGLLENDYNILIEKAVKPLKRCGAKVWVFGSRARGDNKPFSDIDILFDLPKNQIFPPGFLFSLRDDLENSNISIKVDLVNRQELAASYADQIEKDKVEL